jgi:alpha,alpha-trehalase
VRFSLLLSTHSLLYIRGIKINKTHPDRNPIRRDRPLKIPATAVAQAFARLSPSDLDYREDAHKRALYKFIEEFFEPAESDLLRPFDSSPLPPPPLDWLPLATSPTCRAWANALHLTWATLCRRAAPCVAAHTGLHTLLPVTGPFIIPGARFREGYYWDTYWAVRGLMVSGLAQLAKDVVLNFIKLVSSHGFVPNGLRSYYLNRSQPPLLAAMLAEIWAATKDRQLLERALPALKQELDWWREPPHGLTLRGSRDGKLHQVSRYYANWERPRPESFREDIGTVAGAGLQVDSRAESDEIACRRMYRDIASAAESGWDFSSRWFADGASMATIQTTRVIPVDLNALLLKAEQIATELAVEAGQDHLAALFASRAQERLLAINSLFWDDSQGRWRDLILNDAFAAGLDDIDPTESASTDVSASFGTRTSVRYASDWIPLWCGCAEPESARAKAAVQSLECSGLLQPGGVAASTSQSGQQWDWPNAWPPLQAMLAEGCEAVGGETGSRLAMEIARRFLKSSHDAWKTTGCMFEKYNVEKPGQPGGGGEYEVVVGFGWTNGLALSWLDKYGSSYLQDGNSA